MKLLPSVAHLAEHAGLTADHVHRVVARVRLQRRDGDANVACVSWLADGQGDTDAGKSQSEAADTLETTENKGQTPESVVSAPQERGSVVSTPQEKEAPQEKEV